MKLHLQESRIKNRAVNNFPLHLLLPPSMLFPFYLPMLRNPITQYLWRQEMPTNAESFLILYIWSVTVLAVIYILSPWRRIGGKLPHQCAVETDLVSSCLSCDQYSFFICSLCPRFTHALTRSRNFSCTGFSHIIYPSFLLFSGFTTLIWAAIQAGRRQRGPCVKRSKDCGRGRWRKVSDWAKPNEKRKKNPNLSINLLSSPVGRCWERLQQVTGQRNK